MSKDQWVEDEQEPELIGSYEILHAIGRGSFGDVKCAKRAFGDEDADLYALKICSRSQLKKIKLCEYGIDGALLRFTGVQRFEKECSILESLTHPNIVQFCEVFHDEEEDLLVLVTAYTPLGPALHFEESTQRYVYNAALVALHKGVFEVEGVLGYFRDIVQAVAHLHKLNICHRDIKPANILLAPASHTSHTAHTTSAPLSSPSTRPYKLILCDFGAAEQFNPHINPAGLVSHTAGSPADWAPEAVFPEKYDTDVGLDLASERPEKVTQDDLKTPELEDANSNKVHRFSAYGLDMWALGVVLYEMFYMRHPFYSAELSEVELFERIDAHDPLFAVTNDVSIVDTVDTHAHKLDMRRARITVQPPRVECVSILEGLLQKDPTMRWSVDTLFDFDVLA